MSVTILSLLVCVFRLNFAFQPFRFADVNSGGNSGACAFDMCVIIPNYCLNDGKCSTNIATCESKCFCSEGYAGKTCKDVVLKKPSTKTSTTKIMDETTKQPNGICGPVRCVNGKCIEVYPIGFQCICKDGWFGESCNTYGEVFDLSNFDKSAEKKSKHPTQTENKNARTSPFLSQITTVSSSSSSSSTSKESLPSTPPPKDTKDVDDDVAEHRVIHDPEDLENRRTLDTNITASKQNDSSNANVAKNVTTSERFGNHTEVSETDNDDAESTNKTKINVNTEILNKTDASNKSTRKDTTDTPLKSKDTIQNSLVIKNNDPENEVRKNKSNSSDITEKEFTLNETRSLEKYVKDSMSSNLARNLQSMTDGINESKTQQVMLDNKAISEHNINEPYGQLEGEGLEMNQKYNVCSEQFEDRPLRERKCDVHDDLKCIYGECEQTEVDHGTWKGYVTACKCYYGARGTYCEHKCCLECGFNGKCDVLSEGDNVTKHCTCRQRYTGQFCEIFVPDPVSIQMKENTWYIWVVGVCVGAFVIMVTLSVIGPYFMWKHRVILVMKIVHYFQAYEDDDDKEWDAFVSYKSHPLDEKFVVDVLYPKLELELGFKLCLHFRDFVAGETISNNIINAVEGSRRTIIILTPRYIESEFTQFEYQKAQTEMLKRKHRIIPILLEDISSVASNMDKNLKGIISSVTYLEWPNESDKSKKEDKFWKRLQLSLPKKKISDSEKGSSHLQSSSIDGAVNSQTIRSPISNSNHCNSTAQQYISSSDPLLVSSSGMFNVSLSDDADEETYYEIGQIDDHFTELIQPMTDAEEAALVQSSENTNNSMEVLAPQTDSVFHHNQQFTDLSRLQCQPEVIVSCCNTTESNIQSEISHLDNHSSANTPGNKYIEFKIEDNPPSPSLIRAQKQGMADISNYDYPDVSDIEFRTVNDSNEANYAGNKYIEFKIEDNPPSPSIIKAQKQDKADSSNYDYPDVSDSELRGENDSGEANNAGNKYLELKIEDNPPSPSLIRAQSEAANVDPDCNYTEVDSDMIEQTPSDPNPNIGRGHILNDSIDTHCKHIALDLETTESHAADLNSIIAQHSGNDHLEFREEDNPSSPSLIRSNVPHKGVDVLEDYTNTSISSGCPSHDLDMLLVPGTDKYYVEFREADNPPSPTLSRLQKEHSMELLNESSTDDHYTDIIVKETGGDFKLSFSDSDNKCSDVRKTNAYINSPENYASNQNSRTCLGISFGNEGYFEAEV